MKNPADAALRLKWSGLGIYRCAPTAASGESIRKLSAEMYCEGVLLGAGPASAPPPEPEKTADPEPVKKPPESEAKSPEDQGDRDPKGVSRYESCIRTAFNAYRQKTFSEESASYSTKHLPSQIEEFYEKAMKEGGWEEQARSEDGDIKKGTNKLDLVYKKDSVTARLDVGPTKDGVTVFTWHVRDELTLRKPLPDRK